MQAEVNSARRKVTEAGERSEADRTAMAAAAEEAVRLYNAKQAEVVELKTELRKAADKVWRVWLTVQLTVGLNPPLLIPFSSPSHPLGRH